MSIEDFRAWARKYEIQFIDDLSNDSIVVSHCGKDIGRFFKNDLAIKLGSQTRVCFHIWQKINPLIERDTATEQRERMRAAEERERIHKETMDRIIRESMERMTRQRMWEQAFRNNSYTASGWDTSRPQPQARTAEQRSGIEKARKVKRMMDATDNAGVRANARSALDNLLSKHGITEADL